MGFSLAGKIGPLIPFAALGLVAYTWHRPKEAVDKFVLTAVLLFLPLLPLRDYIAEFLFLFFVPPPALAPLHLPDLTSNRRPLLPRPTRTFAVGSISTSR